MKRRWPSMFVQEAKRRPGKVFGLEPEGGSAGECENCGGRGYLAAFFAERGPFLKVPPCDWKTEALHSVEDPVYGWQWYVGRTMVDVCPVCRGRMIKAQAPPKPKMSYEEYAQQFPAQVEEEVAA